MREQPVLFLNPQHPLFGVSCQEDQYPQLVFDAVKTMLHISRYIDYGAFLNSPILRLNSMISVGQTKVKSSG